MKIIFFGTSSFAVPGLKALAVSRHKVLLVVTQPDRKKGRNLAVKPPPIKEVASSLGISVFQPENASSVDSIMELKKINADLFVIISYGQILKESLLSLPAKFCINLHASILPKYRGAAPINWAIINGEDKTGVTVFKLEKRMDAGDIILTKEADIEEMDTALTLNERLSHVGAGALLEAVDLIERGRVTLIRQDEKEATYAPKLKKSDGLIDWELPAAVLHNKVRGLIPWPAAFTRLKDKTIKILATGMEYCNSRPEGSPGQIVAVEPGAGIVIKTAEGCLTVHKLQLEGSRPMRFDEFLRGHKLKIGDLFGKQ